MTVGCLSFLGIPNIYHMEGGDPTPKEGDPIFYEIACNPMVNVKKNDSIEKVRKLLMPHAEKSIQEEINRQIKEMEDFGCINVVVTYRENLATLPADDPRNNKVGIVSYVYIAIAGEKTENIEIFGIRA